MILFLALSFSVISFICPTTEIVVLYPQLVKSGDVLTTGEINTASSGHSTKHQQHTTQS
jgi:hypothetical protein